MKYLPEAFQALRSLLSYPDQHTVQSCELLFVVSQGVSPEAARLVSSFGAFAEQSEVWELEEAYTRTFDVNPSCALEVGWHLFGEEYARGMFLVRMREELRKYDLPESAELPDHICHVLDVLNFMPEEERERFAKACVQPAVEKMVTALDGTGSPYQDVVRCLAEFLREIFGEVNVADEREAFDLSREIGGDPLRDYPVAAQASECGTGSCCSQAKLVQLQIQPESETVQEAPQANRESS